MASGYALFNGIGIGGGTPDHASLDIVGDIDIRALISPVTWTATGTMVSKGVWPGDRAYDFGFQSDFLQFSFVDPLSGDLGVQSQAEVLGVDGVPMWVRATLDVDNGDSGMTGRFYTSNDPIDTDPASVVWTEINGGDIHPDNFVSIITNSEPVSIGHEGGDRGPFAGWIYYLEIRDGINGTIVANPDFRDDDQKTGDSPTTFTDTTGKVWTFDTAIWVPPSGGGRRKTRPPRNPRRYQV